MIHYIYAVIADMLYASSSLSQKKYQLKAGDSVNANNLYNFLTGVLLAIVFFIACGFTPDFTAYSLMMAAFQAIIAIINTVIGFIVIRRGSLSLFVIFLMTGGMIVPYVWGIFFLSEAATFLRILGIILITVSIVVASFEKKKIDLWCVILCITVFFVNGMSSVLTKIHQVQTTYPIIGEIDFIFWSNILKAAFCLLILLLMKKGEPLGKPQGLLFIFLAAIASGLAGFCNMKGAVHIPASVLYPLITGGTIVFSYVGERIVFKEKVTLRNILPIIICFMGTLMFL